MKNVLNLFFILFILIFFWSTYDYYSSNKNIKVKEFNHKNIDEIINKNISNIPILKNIGLTMQKFPTDRSNLWILTT